MSLLRLPNEVLLQIQENIIEKDDIRHFALVNRRLYETLIDQIYLRDIHSGESRALFWSIYHSKEATLRRAIRVGAELNSQVVKWPSGILLNLLSGLNPIELVCWTHPGPLQYLQIVPLSVAARVGDPAILKLLLEAGAKVEVCMEVHPTVLDLAVMGGSLEAFHLICKHTPLAEHGSVKAHHFA